MVMAIQLDFFRKSDLTGHSDPVRSEQYIHNELIVLIKDRFTYSKILSKGVRNGHF